MATNTDDLMTVQPSVFLKVFDRAITNKCQAWFCVEHEPNRIIITTTQPGNEIPVAQFITQFDDLMSQCDREPLELLVSRSLVELYQ